MKNLLSTASAGIAVSQRKVRQISDPIQQILIQLHKIIYITQVSVLAFYYLLILNMNSLIILLKNFVELPMTVSTCSSAPQLQICGGHCGLAAEPGRQ